MAVWFDVDDLIRFFQGATRPTGIQRFSFETCSAAANLAGLHGDVRFCRRDAKGLRAIHFPALEAGIRAIAEAPRTPSHLERRTAATLHPALASMARGVAPQYRGPLVRMARAGRAGLGAAKELAMLGLASCRSGAGGAPRIGGHAFDLDSDPVRLGAGDWLINLGASWERPYGSAFLDGLADAGASFALLAHDMIPDMFPEWCTGLMVRDFSAWLDDAVPRANVMCAVSHSTARDLRACLARRGHAIPPPLVLPTGSAKCHDAAALPPLLHEPYVLMVGTIEARKNHAGMLRVWRRLLAAHPPEAVPVLVFAGKTGWLTGDLMQQLENAGWLQGKIRFINQPSDSALASLYQHCLFTVFPSLYEGWGLPVSESLSFGKPVAASSRAAIREAGGEFCVYFDPDNLDDAAGVIGGMIGDPAYVARLSARIAAHYLPPSWEDTAGALLACCGVAPPMEAAFPELSFSRSGNSLPAHPYQG